MRFWIDGDSCPRKAMEIALRAQGRQGLQVVVVADRTVPGVEEHGAAMILVPHGSGNADDIILADSDKGDIALTRDFVLGIKLLDNGLKVINDRGKLWNLRDLKNRAEEAELMQALRNGGIAKKAARNYSPEDSHNFAATLDRLLNDSP